MNEFGEEVTIYVWPKGHEPYTKYPDDFYDKVQKALDAAGIDWEYV